MTRRILLIPLFMILSVGMVKAQRADQGDRASTVSSRDVLIRQAKAFSDQIEDAMRRSDENALDRYYADDFICKDERFGIGEVLHKKQFLERRGHANHGPEDQVIKLAQSKVQWIVVGDMVIRSGYSTTILKHRGRLSKGPRLFTFVYVKQNGQWRFVALDVFDVPNGSKEPR
jgi:ketosteroid isomerase-like protein